MVARCERERARPERGSRLFLSLVSFLAFVYVCARIYMQRGVFSEISVWCPSAPNNWYQSKVEGGESPGSTVLCTLLEIEKTEVGQKPVLTTDLDSP